MSIKVRGGGDDIRLCEMEERNKERQRWVTEREAAPIADFSTFEVSYLGKVLNN
jgi:hypothetical protein